MPVTVIGKAHFPAEIIFCCGFVLSLQDAWHPFPLFEMPWTLHPSRPAWKWATGAPPWGPAATGTAEPGSACRAAGTSPGVCTSLRHLRGNLSELFWAISEIKTSAFFSLHGEKPNLFPLQTTDVPGPFLKAKPLPKKILLEFDN